MSRTAIKLTGLETNGNGTNTQKLPTGVDIYSLSIEVLSGTVALANFGLFTLYANTDPLQQFLTGEELDDINRYDNPALQYGAGSRNILHLPLERLGLRDRAAFYGATLQLNVPSNGDGQGSGNPNAMGVAPGVPVFTSGRLEFVVAGAITPSFQVWANLERKIDVAAGAGAVTRRKRYTDVIAGTTEEGFSFIKFGNRQLRFIRRIFLANSGGGINRVRLTMDGEEKFNRTAVENTAWQLAYGKTGPVGIWDYIIDFTENGEPEDLDTMGAGELELLITAAAAGNLVAIVEYGGLAY
jgi:hypothetical protein